MVNWPVVIHNYGKQRVDEHGVDKAGGAVNRDAAFDVKAVKLVQAQQAKYQVKGSKNIVVQQYRAYHHYNKKKARYGACLHKLI